MSGTEVDSGRNAATAEQLRGWLVHEAQAPSGAFYAWVDTSRGVPGYEYPEITGYALTHIASLNDPSGEEVGAGMLAGKWLIDRIRSGDRVARSDTDGGASYVFDLAMISTGLFAFGDRHGQPEFADVADLLTREIAESVLDGRLEAILGERDPLLRSAWSTEGRAHLLKLLQALLVAAKGGAKSVDYSAAASLLASSAAEVQAPNGRFVTHPADLETMLHPHFYAVEGLWMYAEATGDDEARARARIAVEWAWTHQLPSGGFPRFVSTSNGRQLGPEQCDVTAQAIRTALLLGIRPDRLPDAITRLQDTAVKIGELRAALPYQPAGEGHAHANTWASLFGYQALSLASGEPLQWPYLV